ncbi:CRISPR-associated protein Cas4 [Segatella bryantii]|uniref:CRISPR-associated protein Cas4 n=1 Tax=Segatella bryantii TaxID=77095 RepID=UPI00242EC0E2|nr:CRISPR-associated protein Cas4 [Segatella bryantii]
MYSEDDMLMLSGIQHFRFCPRQWALIHMEQQWEENRLTTEGNILHKHVDDPFYRQKCKENICLRSVNVASRKLGLYGVTDVVELHPTLEENNSILHPGYPGRWILYPIEYKHGRPKKNQIDEVQLAAQAMCLEEIYGVPVMKGALYYEQTKRRVEVCFTEQLRDIVQDCALQMHNTYLSARIPQASYQQFCDKCSLINICMPLKPKDMSASYYLKKSLYEEAT